MACTAWGILDIPLRYKHHKVPEIPLQSFGFRPQEMPVLLVNGTVIPNAVGSDSKKDKKDDEKKAKIQRIKQLLVEEQAQDEKRSELHAKRASNPTSPVVRATTSAFYHPTLTPLLAQLATEAGEQAPGFVPAWGLEGLRGSGSTTLVLWDDNL